MSIEQVTAFKTSDGKLHKTEAQAKNHEVALSLNDLLASWGLEGRNGAIRDEELQALVRRDPKRFDQIDTLIVYLNATLKDARAKCAAAAAHGEKLARSGRAP